MRNLTLTACEAEVMNVVWSQQAVTVQDVVDAIPRELAYTTVMTTMKILEEKGFIARREKRGRAYVYEALISCESATRNTVSEMANRFFDGSVKTMVLSLIKTQQISAGDLAELRDAIDAIDSLEQNK
jgi:BlaI family transcriptional regulator, penicillinase repressor